MESDSSFLLFNSEKKKLTSKFHIIKIKNIINILYIIIIIKVYNFLKKNYGIIYISMGDNANNKW